MRRAAAGPSPPLASGAQSSSWAESSFGQRCAEQQLGRVLLWPAVRRAAAGPSPPMASGAQSSSWAESSYGQRCAEQQQPQRQRQHQHPLGKCQRCKSWTPPQTFRSRTPENGAQRPVSTNLPDASCARKLRATVLRPDFRSRNFHWSPVQTTRMLSWIQVSLPWGLPRERPGVYSVEHPDQGLDGVSRY